jgi:hypothetical protein
VIELPDIGSPGTADSDACTTGRSDPAARLTGLLAEALRHVEVDQDRDVVEVAVQRDLLVHLTDERDPLDPDPRRFDVAGSVGQEHRDPAAPQRAGAVGAVAEDRIGETEDRRNNRPVTLGGKVRRGSGERGQESRLRARGGVAGVA